jgi:hypothetical protein
MNKIKCIYLIIFVTCSQPFQNLISMPKRIIEILISILLSLSLWIYYENSSIPLIPSETLLIVGVMLILSLIVGSIIRKIFSNESKN